MSFLSQLARDFDLVKKKAKARSKAKAKAKRKMPGRKANGEFRKKK